MRSLLQAALDLAVALAPHALALLRQLAQAAVMGTLFVLAVWVLCRLAPRLPAGVRCALWWLASLKLLLGLVWPAPLTLPLLPPTSSQSAAAGLARWFAPEQAAERASLPAPSLGAAATAHNLAGASISAGDHGAGWNGGEQDEKGGCEKGADDTHRRIRSHRALLSVQINLKKVGQPM